MTEKSGNVASRVRSRILGGTNNEIIKIDRIYPEESIASGNRKSAFTSNDGWCSLNDDNYVQFSKEIVIG